MLWTCTILIYLLFFEVSKECTIMLFDNSNELVKNIHQICFVDYQLIWIQFAHEETLIKWSNGVASISGASLPFRRFIHLLHDLMGIPLLEKPQTQFEAHDKNGPGKIMVFALSCRLKNGPGTLSKLTVMFFLAACIHLPGAAAAEEWVTGAALGPETLQMGSRNKFVPFGNGDPKTKNSRGTESDTLHVCACEWSLGITHFCYPNNCCFHNTLTRCSVT